MQIGQQTRQTSDWPTVATQADAREFPQDEPRTRQPSRKENLVCRGTNSSGWQADRRARLKSYRLGDGPRRRFRREINGKAMAAAVAGGDDANQQQFG